MSVRFYNTNGWMIGVDFHLFQAAVPPDPFPVPLPFHPHIVIVKLSWGFCSAKSRLGNVTSDAAPMLQKGHTLKMVPHIFVPCALPHPAEALQIAAVIASSKTTCVMGVASVTGGGEPLATCLAGFWGLNLDCSSPTNLPTGNVFNGNTVRTTPAASDYINAWIDVALSGLEKVIETVLGKSKAGQLYKKYKEVKKDPEVSCAEQVQKFILKQISPYLPVSPSSIEKQIQKKREELVRELLGGHG